MVQKVVRLLCCSYCTTWRFLITSSRAERWHGIYVIDRSLWSTTQCCKEMKYCKGMAALAQSSIKFCSVSRDHHDTTILCQLFALWANLSLILYAVSCPALSLAVPRPQIVKLTWQTRYLVRVADQLERLFDPVFALFTHWLLSLIIHVFCWWLKRNHNC